MSWYDEMELAEQEYDNLEYEKSLAYQQGRAEAIDDVLKLERLNHYDMCEELMYQSIKVDDIERLKEQE